MNSASIRSGNNLFSLMQINHARGASISTGVPDIGLELGSAQGRFNNAALSYMEDSTKALLDRKFSEPYFSHLG